MKRILKKRIKLILFITILFAIVNIALSFSYLRGEARYNESVSTISLTGGTIRVKYSSSTGSLTISNINPGYEGSKQFTITSDFGANHEYYVDGIWYTVVLKVEKNEFDTNSIQYSLSLDSTSDNDGITIANIQNKGIPTGTNTSGIILGSGKINTHNKSHIYNLKISYPDNGTDQSHEIGCKFNAYIDFINTNMVGLTFDLDGGSFTNLNLNENSSIKVPANSKINLPVPNKEGYIFAGWEVLSRNVSTNSNVISTGNSDISIKALWNDNIPYEFAYTGGEQQFIAEVPGYYKIETWGASGGYAYDSTRSTGGGGYGGYSSGIINLNYNQTLYINIGGEGESNCQTKSCDGGYNGGSSSSKWRNGNGEGLWTGGGGGATHIATMSGLLYLLENSKSHILIVSGGGGGGDYYPSWSDNLYKYSSTGGSGGGYVGNNGIAGTVDSSYPLGEVRNNYGGTQTSGSSFGKATTTFLTDSTGGGGGGFYGGFASLCHTTGGGGSGYIGNSLLTDKYMYCYDCATSAVESTKTYTTTCVNETPTENCAKIGNGYARITYLHS